MNEEGPSEEELARRARGGDQEAFAALVHRFSAHLFNFSLRMLGNPADAEDVVQVTLLQFYRALPVLDLSTSVRPWLFQCARTRCLDVLRRRRTVAFSELRPVDEEGTSPVERLADPEPLPEELAERSDLQTILQAAIQALPVRYREVVALRYTTELTFAEIAAALGVPENTAKTLFQRAKAQLRAQLQAVLERVPN